MTAKEFLWKKECFSEMFSMRIAYDLLDLNYPFMYKREDLIEFAEKYHKQFKTK